MKHFTVIFSNVAIRVKAKSIHALNKALGEVGLVPLGIDQDKPE